MKRSIITTDGNGNITLPTDIGATAMSEYDTPVFQTDGVRFSSKEEQAMRA